MTHPALKYLYTGAKLFLVNLLTFLAITLYNLLATQVTNASLMAGLLILAIPLIFLIQGWLANQLYGWR